MVFFTCNSCGQCVKKAHVEKHYLTECRSCEVLSCMDCGKDFVGDDYKHHTKCVSENEKYGGKDYKANAKPNKGEVKQSQWLESVQAASSSQSVSPRVRGLLNRLTDYSNIPRKKAKFERFIQNSLKVWDTSIIEQIWTVFSAAGNNKPVEKTSQDDSKQLKTAEGTGTENGSSSAGDHSETRPPEEAKAKKSKVRGSDLEKLEGSTTQEKGPDRQDLGKEEQTEPKKKKKKTKKDKKSVSSQDSDNPVHDGSAQEQGTVNEEGWDNQTARQGEEDCRELPKKKKKRKHTHGQAEDGAADGGNCCNEDLASKGNGVGDGHLPEKKKKRKREKERVEEDSTTESNGTQITGSCSHEKVESDVGILWKKKKRKTPQKHRAQGPDGIEGGSEGDQSPKKTRKTKKEKHMRIDEEPRGLLGGIGEEEQAVHQASREKRKKKKKNGSLVTACDDSRNSRAGMDGLLSGQKKMNANSGTGWKGDTCETSVDGLLVVKTPKKKDPGPGPASTRKLKKKSQSGESGIEADKEGGATASNSEGTSSKLTKKAKRKLEEGSLDETTVTKKKKKRVRKELIPKIEIQ